jgi:hypothetical protein
MQLQMWTIIFENRIDSNGIRVYRRIDDHAFLFFVRISIIFPSRISDD